MGAYNLPTGPWYAAATTSQIGVRGYAQTLLGQYEQFVSALPPDLQLVALQAGYTTHSVIDFNLYQGPNGTVLAIYDYGAPVAAFWSTGQPLWKSAAPGFTHLALARLVAAVRSFVSPKRIVMAKSAPRTYVMHVGGGTLSFSPIMHFDKDEVGALSTGEAVALVGGGLLAVILVAAFLGALPFAILFHFWKGWGWWKSLLVGFGASAILGTVASMFHSSSSGSSSLPASGSNPLPAGPVTDPGSTVPAGPSPATPAAAVAAAAPAQQTAGVFGPVTPLPVVPMAAAAPGAAVSVRRPV